MNTTDGSLYNDSLLVNSTASDGSCTSSCVLIYPAALLLCFIIFTAFIQEIPYAHFIRY